MPVIEEFYVVNSAGSCFYAKSKWGQIDTSLFSGFISVMEAIADQYTPEGLRSINLKNHKFFILKAEGLLFVASTAPNAKEKEVQKDMWAMQVLFFQEFPPSWIANAWDGDLNAFSKLDSLLDRFFVQSAVKRMESLF